MTKGGEGGRRIAAARWVDEVDRVDGVDRWTLSGVAAGMGYALSMPAASRTLRAMADTSSSP